MTRGHYHTPSLPGVLAPSSPGQSKFSFGDSRCLLFTSHSLECIAWTRLAPLFLRPPPTSPHLDILFPSPNLLGTHIENAHIFPPTHKKASATFHQGEGIWIRSCPEKPCWGRRAAQGTWWLNSGLAAGIVSGLGARWPRAPAPHREWCIPFSALEKCGDSAVIGKALSPNPPTPQKKDQGEKTLKPT